MSWAPAAIAGAAAAAGIVLLLILLVPAWYYLWLRRRRASPNRNNSETGSSDPSTLVEWNRGGGRVSSSAGPEHPGARQFSLEELAQATKNFSDSNLVGAGSFGLVYKGLLLDGTVVVVKRRAAPARLEFVGEVKRLSEIWHRNIVAFIGYCQEAGLQMLVFEYLPNGSICGHLYISSVAATATATRLEFKQRLSIAIGVAKGLCHLHSLEPPLPHRNFKTSNVLVDENFIAKVADIGLVKLNGGSNAGPSQASSFRDPEVHPSGQLTEASDVYSFGVFLLELITGRESASLMPAPQELSHGLAHWVEAHLIGSTDGVDPRLCGGFTSEGMTDLVGLTVQCLHPSGRGRPRMRRAVAELDQILELEMSLTTVMGDGTAIVTLGSQLFTAS